MKLAVFGLASRLLQAPSLQVTLARFVPITEQLQRWTDERTSLMNISAQNMISQGDHDLITRNSPLLRVFQRCVYLNNHQFLFIICEHSRKPSCTDSKTKLSPESIRSLTFTDAWREDGADARLTRFGQSLRGSRDWLNVFEEVRCSVSTGLPRENTVHQPFHLHDTSS